VQPVELVKVSSLSSLLQSSDLDTQTTWGRMNDTAVSTRLKLKWAYEELLHYVGIQNDDKQNN